MADIVEMKSQTDLYLLFGTEGGALIGYAFRNNDVRYADICKSDSTDEALTELLNSRETTECFTMVLSGRTFYGFECYFVPADPTETIIIM